MTSKTPMGNATYGKKTFVYTNSAQTLQRNQMQNKNAGGSTDIATDWQRLFAASPALAQQQISSPTIQDTNHRFRGKSVVQIRSPGSREDNSQNRMQNHYYHSGLNNPRLRNMTASSGGQNRFLIKEERDLQKAILSIQSYAQNNLRDSFNLTMPVTPSQYQLGFQKAPKIIELARRRPQDQPFNFVNKKHQSAESFAKKGKLFSPSSKEGINFYKNKDLKDNVMLSEGRKSIKSRSQSPDETIDLAQRKGFLSDMIMQSEIQLGGDLIYTAADNIKVQKLLVNNNYSTMLQNVDKMKRASDFNHKYYQNVKLVTDLHSNYQEQIFKGANTQVIKEFINTTDNAAISKLNAKESLWQFKGNVSHNLKTQIYSSELINNRKISTGYLRRRKQSDMMSANKSSSNSPNRSASAERMSRAKTSYSNTRRNIASPIVNEKKEQIKVDQDGSYDQYVQSLANRANMQQMISQNLIKVKYTKTGERNQERKNNLASESLSSIQTIDEIISAKVEKNRQQSPIEFDEEKLIQDFISERDQFISKHRKKNRLIFNMNYDEKGAINVVEIGELSLRDFLKNNRINPKIFTAPDQLRDELRPDLNKKEYYLQKSVHLIQTQKIQQARTFLINALKEYPVEISLQFNKGLVHYLNQEYRECARICYSLIDQLQQRNLVLINLFLSHLQSKEYEAVLDLQERIQKKDDYLDFNEKQLRMMALFAREKLKFEDNQRFQQYMQKQKQMRDARASQQAQEDAKNQSQEELLQNSQVTFQFRKDLNNESQRYDELFEKRQITIVDEQSRTDDDRRLLNDDTIFQNHPSVDDVVQYQLHTLEDFEHTNSFSPLKKGSFKPMNNLTPDKFRDSDKESSQKVQFSNDFNHTLERFESNLTVDVFSKQKQIDESMKTGEESTTLKKGLDEKDDRVIQANISALRKDCEGDNNTIDFLNKLLKRKTSTKIILTKREEFFLKKHRKAIQDLLDPDNKYFYQKFIRPENEQYMKRRTTIKIDASKFINKTGTELETEEIKLMKLLGITTEKIEERMRKHKSNSFHKNQTPILNQLNHQQDEQEAENNEFTSKTQDFITFLFQEYGLKEVILPGTEHASIFQDIRNIEQLNNYVNKLSEFMTTKTVYLTNEKHKLQNEVDNNHKQTEKKKKYTRGFDSDRSDVNLDLDPSQEEFEEDNMQHQLESFQNVLEIKLIDMAGNQNNDESEFYQSLLQKLNAIDLLQLFLKQCAKKIKSGEKLLTFKKELSFGMLQIFREQICRKELIDRNLKLGINKDRQLKADYDMIDKTVRRLRFFKNFAPNIRLKLYAVSKYEIVPPGRIIAHQEEFESHIFVVISGIASLTVKYLETNESYSGMLIYPGDAIGDANIKDKIVISKGRGEAKTYLSSVKECDVLVFDRKQFTDVLFKDMMDSLYEKIIAMRSSEFFENLSPYAMVILCSNVELIEYSYGDVILRQEMHPEECFIIISGECKLVLETVIYKAQEENSAKKTSSAMKFGNMSYNPTEKYGFSKEKQKSQKLAMIHSSNKNKDKLINQKKLNEKFSFQHEKLEIPDDLAERSASPVMRAPILNNNEVSSYSEMKQGGAKMIAYRHHLYYDKLVQGKVLCSRALLERDYAKKFINRKFDHFQEQLELDNQQQQSSMYGDQSRPMTQQMSLFSPQRNNVDQLKTKNYHTPPSENNYQEPAVVTNEIKIENNPSIFHSPSQQVNHNSGLPEFELRMDSKLLDGERDDEVDKMYGILMKSQLTVVSINKLFNLLIDR